MTVSPALLPIVRAQLAEDERLAWGMSAEPAAFAPKKRPRGLWDAIAILGGGYAVIGSGVMTFRHGQPLWMLLPLSLVVLGVLAYFVVERLKTRERKRIAGTVYVLTTQRALLIRTFPSLSVQALPIASIVDIALDNPRKAFADLTLSTGATPPVSMVFGGVFEAERARTQMLAVIRDPSAAEQHLAASERYLMTMRQFARR